MCVILIKSYTLIGNFSLDCSTGQCCRRVMVFGGLGEQELGGRDVEAWIEDEQQWRLREDFRLFKMPLPLL